MQKLKNNICYSYIKTTETSNAIDAHIHKNNKKIKQKYMYYKKYPMNYIYIYFMLFYLWFLF